MTNNTNETLSNLFFEFTVVSGKNGVLVEVTQQAAYPFTLDPSQSVFANNDIQNERIPDIEETMHFDGDTLLTEVPHKNNTLNLNVSVTQQFRFMDTVHDAAVSFSSLNTRDDVFVFGDAKNAFFSLNIRTRFENLPLRTQIGITINNTQFESGQLDIDIFGLYAGGTYFMLDGKLMLNSKD